MLIDYNPYAYFSFSYIEKSGKKFGRVRIRSPLIKKEAELIQKNLYKIDGIKKVDVNPLTGSLLIFFEPQLLSGDKLLSILKEQKIYFQEININNKNDRIDYFYYFDQINRIIFIMGLVKLIFEFTPQKVAFKFIEEIIFGALCGVAKKTYKNITN